MAQGSDSPAIEQAPASEPPAAPDSATTPLFASTGAEATRPEPALGGDDLLTPSSSAQLLASLALVLLVILALGWLSRRLHRLQPGRDGRALRVLDVLSVGARERVALVQVGSTQLVLGLAPGRVQTLHVLESTQGAGSDANTPETASAPSTAASPFASLLKR